VRLGTRDTGAQVAPAEGSKRLLGEILVERQQLTPAQLSEALVQQRVSGKRLGQLLVELGALDERDLAEALGEHFGVPVVDLRREAPEEAAIARIPERTARSLSVVPLKLVDGILEVAVADPSDQLGRDLHQVAGVPIRMIVASTSDIRRATDRGYRALAALQQHVAAFQAANPAGEAVGTQAAVNSDAAPVVQVVNLLLAQALRDRASDVHVEPMGATVRVRFRIDGVLHEVVSLPGSMGGAMVSRLKVLAGMNIVERRRAQDGQVAMTVDGRAIDIRVATTGTVAGEKVVLRLLDKSRPMYQLSDLGLPDRTLDELNSMVRSPFGMVVCAGPTGSGKTTSLYATLSALNSPERNIMTIEDPVEFAFPSINQIQINEAAGVTFASGLKSILRQDPDVILVGEIRDTETATIAVQSALTGHFVASSLHSTDAVSALLRLLDMGIEPFVVSSAVLGVLSQRLVRRICEECKVVYQPSTEEKAFYRSSGGVVPRTGLWRGEGCMFCANTGYQGRIGVYELLRLTPEIKALVAGRAAYEQVRELAAEQGMRTMRAEAVRLVAEGVTTIAEVVRSIYVL
jgi:type IV pilus assembly protein PilB